MVAAVERQALQEEVAISCAVARADELASRLGGQQFDVVLCHNVLGYVDDPRAACAELAGLVAAGGQLSITAANRFAEPLRIALMNHDLAQALDAAESASLTQHSRVTQMTGERLKLTDPNELCQWITDAQLDVEVWLGGRIVNDFLHDANALKADDEEYARLLQLELALSDRDPYRQLAPLIHVIARSRIT
jgi:S-adenosylmethionine-dependent methyltransferase